MRDGSNSHCVSGRSIRVTGSAVALQISCELMSLYLKPLVNGGCHSSCGYGAILYSLGALSGAEDRDIVPYRLLLSVTVFNVVFGPRCVGDGVLL